MPIERSWFAIHSAACCMSGLCSGSVEMDGMVRTSFISVRNRSWFWCAYSRASFSMSSSLLWSYSGLCGGLQRSAGDHVPAIDECQAVAGIIQQRSILYAAHLRVHAVVVDRVV